MTVDETDKKIIAVLDRDASLGYNEVARKLRLNESTVRVRIRSLSERNVIRFGIQVDKEQLGFKIEAWLCLDVEPSRLIGLGDVIPSIPGVRMVFWVTGEHDFVVVTWSANRAALSKLVDRFVALEGVRKVSPSIILERLK